MPTDIQIAQAATPRRIDEIAAAAGIPEEALFPYGRYVAKVDPLKIKGEQKAKLILVTRFPNAPGAQYADLLLICGAHESPAQQGSIAAKISQLFIVDVLFHEFCARNHIDFIYQEPIARNSSK